MSEPTPPVPADCDLRSFPYLPLDVVRLRDSRLAATATGDEFRAAVLLWCAAWHQVPAASLPNDDRELAALAGYGRDLRGWAKVRAMALHGWEMIGGRLWHAVVAEKAAEAWRQRQMQRAKAEKRWGNAASRGAGTPTADATASPTADAQAMQQIQNRTEQKGVGESAPAAASPPTPPLEPTGSKSNREALSRKLRRLGIPSNDQAVQEWADMMQGRGKCKTPAQVLDGIAWIIRARPATKYAREAPDLADQWAAKVAAQDEGGCT
jgi:hypothetical protein